jgi:uncharacterized protein (TIGR03437 family)
MLLGNGTGGFAAMPGSPFAVGALNPETLVAGDFNGDGIPDLATGNVSGSISVLLGNGSGGFTAAPGSPFAAEVQNYSFMAVGDFNGDGIQDLVVSEDNSDDVTVLLGNGLGGFTTAPSSPFAVGKYPLSVAVGDFNGDGIQDLATADGLSNTVTVLLGNGMGGFAPAPNSPFSVGNGPNSVVVGDFNGDGIQDLATANGGDLTVTVLLGNGSGGFAAAPGSPSAVGIYTYALTVGDFNGDGIQDLVTPATIILLGDGLGGFTVASGPFTTGNYQYSLAIGDFNGDGIEDLATANSNSRNVTVLLGAPAETDSVLATSLSPTIGLGQSLPLTLTVFDTTTPLTAPAGRATFFDSANILGTSSQTVTPFSFTATNLSVGSHTLTATYTGTAGTSGSTSNSVAIQVVQIGVTPQTITFPVPAPVTLPAAAFALVATASSGLPVSYTSTTPGICTVSGSIATPVAAGTCSITAAQTGDATYSAATPVADSFVIKPATGVGTIPLPTGIANAAGAGQAPPSVVPLGGYVAIYGTLLAGYGVPFAPSLPLPTTLNGTQVTLGGIPMPLLYANPTQINALIPQGLKPNAPYPLVVVTGAVQSAPVPVSVLELQPGIYTVNGSGSGPGIVTDALTGQLNSTANPAHPSDYLVIYCTGLGPLQGPNGQTAPADGALAPLSPLFQTKATVTATVGGVNAPVSFSGLTPTFAGLYQINIQVPAGVEAGSAVPLVITATDSQTGATAQSNWVTIAVQ